MKAFVIGLPVAALSFAATLWVTSSYLPSQAAQANTPQPAHTVVWPTVDRTNKSNWGVFRIKPKQDPCPPREGLTGDPYFHRCFG